MDGPLTDPEATVGPISFAPMAALSRKDRVTELIIGAPKMRQLPTWRPPWEHTSFATMAANRRKAIVTSRQRGR